MTVHLHSGSAALDIDEGWGGELRRLRLAGVPILFEREVAPARGVPGAALDEAAWVAGYGGGWQLLTPYGGLPAGRHAFHGTASTARWRVDDWQADRATLTLDSVDQRVERRTILTDHAISVRTVWERGAAVTDSPLDHFGPVEHCVLGAGALGPDLSEVRLDLASHARFRKTTDEGSAGPWQVWGGGAGLDEWPSSPHPAGRRDAMYEVHRTSWARVTSPLGTLHMDFAGVYDGVRIWIPRTGSHLGVEPALIDQIPGRAGSGWVRLRWEPAAQRRTGEDR